jgi:hypothetical protein
MRVGAALPILATASGLVFAVFLPRHFTEPLIRAAIKAEDGLNLFARDFATIDRLIMQVRKQGYAFNEGHLLTSQKDNKKILASNWGCMFHVRFWPKADMPKNAIDVAIGGKADTPFCSANVCF